jgi:pimeloyl-ACP methyl ester carboxylesterase
LRTLRSVVDYRGQAVSALNRLQLQSELPVMAIWGEKDNIIPVDHAYAAQALREGSRVEVLSCGAPELIAPGLETADRSPDPPLDHIVGRGAFRSDQFPAGSGE